MAGPMTLFRLIVQRLLYLPSYSLDHPCANAMSSQAAGGFNAG